MADKPVGVTLGDPSGVGPEITAKLLLDTDFIKKFPFIPIGKRSILDDTFRLILKTDPPPYPIIETLSPITVAIRYGVSSAEYGELSMSFIRTGVDAALSGSISAIVTAPINKHSVSLAGYPFAGHTEYLGYLTGSTDFSMMLVSPHYRVITATTHIPIKIVAESITQDIILRAIKNAHKAGALFGISSPIVAVCALNPHAGDGGVIGDEEELIIEPAIKTAQAEGIDARGAFPADSLFTCPNTFDFAVSIYHDQGLIPIKMDGFGSAVNVTLNLPIIRTSVDHGTAFDIAGKGLASPASLRSAVILAHKIAGRAICL
ncbi:MAG: 4-hydroxythreonine-4-phosphate dehydrogenase PdxA [Deferribacteraceae bacterium]|nr:4-hydroxythreonine-4-phosphate dehydrogenase PdxA [Deferribacteraceae bacterium]